MRISIQSIRELKMKTLVTEETLTSVLAGDEIDPLAKLDLEITMAHEILELNP